LSNCAVYALFFAILISIPQTNEVFGHHYRSANSQRHRYSLPATAAPSGICLRCLVCILHGFILVGTALVGHGDSSNALISLGAPLSIPSYASNPYSLSLLFPALLQWACNCWYASPKCNAGLCALGNAGTAHHLYLLGSLGEQFGLSAYIWVATDFSLLID
jgi:hypothetical protein